MRIFKLLYVVLVVASAAILCFINLLEWSRVIGTSEFWLDRRIVVCSLVDLGAIVGLFVRNKYGWMLNVFFFYVFTFLFVTFYMAYAGLSLQFMPSGSSLPYCY